MTYGQHAKWYFFSTYEDELVFCPQIITRLDLTKIKFNYLFYLTVININGTYKNALKYFFSDLVGLVHKTNGFYGPKLL